MDMDTSGIPSEGDAVTLSDSHFVQGEVIFSEAQLNESLCENNGDPHQSLQTITITSQALGVDPSSVIILSHAGGEHLSDTAVTVDTAAIIPDIVTSSVTTSILDGSNVTSNVNVTNEILQGNVAVQLETHPPTTSLSEEGDAACTCLTCQKTNGKENLLQQSMGGGCLAEEPSGSDVIKCLVCYSTFNEFHKSDVTVQRDVPTSDNLNRLTACELKKEIGEEIQPAEIDLDTATVINHDGSVKRHPDIDDEFYKHYSGPHVPLKSVFQVLNCSAFKLSKEMGSVNIVPLCSSCGPLVVEALNVIEKIQRLQASINTLREELHSEIIKSFEANYCKKRKDLDDLSTLSGKIDASRKVILSQTSSGLKLLKKLKVARSNKRGKTFVSKSALYPQVKLEASDASKKKGVKSAISDDTNGKTYASESDLFEMEVDEDEVPEVIHTHSGRRVRKPNYKKWLLGDDEDDDKPEEVVEAIEEQFSPKSEGGDWSPGNVDEEDNEFDSTEEEESDLDFESDDGSDTEKQESGYFDFYNSEGGKKGQKTKKKGTNRIKCSEPDCPKTFSTESKMASHVKKKHNTQDPASAGETYPCTKCSKVFRRQALLKRHLEKAHGELSEDCQQSEGGKKKHTCEHCGQKYRNASELRIHIRLHTGETPYKCDHCDKSFVSSLKREFHIEQSHWEIPPLKCDYCPKAFFRQHRLRIHRISHTGEKAYLCEICSQSFSHPTYLKYHQGQHAELNMETFKCKDCGKTFANPTNLRLHVKTVHLKEFRFTCEVCNMGFTHMSHKRIHMRGHTGERPYACDICSEAFRYRDRLRIHMRGHTGERPFVCQACSKGFASRSKLKRHEKIHEKSQSSRLSQDELQRMIRHRCDDCGKGFAEPQHLSAHKRYCLKKDKEDKVKVPKAPQAPKPRAMVQKLDMEPVASHAVPEQSTSMIVVPLNVTGGTVYGYPVSGVYGYDISTQPYHAQPQSQGTVREYQTYN